MQDSCAKMTGGTYPCLGPGKSLGRNGDGFGMEAARGISIFTPPAVLDGSNTTVDFLNSHPHTQ